jgi:hypothetical protein
LTALAVAVTAYALVLLIGGVSKWSEPGAASASLRSAGLPATPAAARAVGAVEVVVGLAVAAFGGEASLGAMSLLYLCFAGVTARRVVAGTPGGCGCFGRRSRDVQASWAHVALDGLGSAIGVIGLALGVAPLFAGRTTGVAAALLVVSTVGAVAIVVALSSGRPATRPGAATPATGWRNT